MTISSRHRNLAVVSTAVFVLAACGGPGASDPTATPTPNDATASPGDQTGIDLSGTGQVIVMDGGGAWGEAKRLAYFEPFEEATGIEVIANPGTDPGRLRAEVESGSPSYDVWSLIGGFLPEYLAADLLEPIDYSWWDPADVDAFAPVASGEYGVPSLYYSLLLAYDEEEFGDNPPEDWADFWNADEYPGMRALPPGTWAADGATLEVALLADGVAPDELYPLDVDRAFQALDRLRPNILTFWESGAEPGQLIIDGQVEMASAWNGRIDAARSEGAAIVGVWNQGVLQYDYWVVPKGAENRENAMKFIAFASQPENQARFAEQITYAPTNSRAYDHISAERAALLPTSPELRDLQVPQDYDWWNAEHEPGVSNTEYVIERWEAWITGN